MSGYTSSKTLPEFLKKHKYIKGFHPCITHTRIPSKEHKVYGGCYYIDTNNNSVLTEFQDLYYDWVFTKQNDEYLTETQKANESPVSKSDTWGSDISRF